jgi:hypothetical protein
MPALLVVAMAIMILMLPTRRFRLVSALLTMIAAIIFIGLSSAFAAFVQALLISHILSHGKTSKQCSDNIPGHFERC